MSEVDQANETDESGEAGDAEPAGTGEYVVKPGECLNSIGYEHGFFPDTLWKLPENSELKIARKDPNVLIAGDRVHIPELRPREESCATEKLHRFKRKGVPAKFTITLNDLGKPRANEDYVLDVDGKLISGKTDGKGTLSAAILPNAKVGRLRVGKDQEEIVINFGHIDPITTLSGVQGRLQNMGLYHGPVDGKMNAETKSAIAEFQRQQNITGEGKLDEKTRQAILEANGS
jgi:N-acetylmuramoyl-L-alanine amidase